MRTRADVRTDIFIQNVLYDIPDAGHMVIRLSDDISHRLWLQGPLNHLGSERRANYIAEMLHRILEFCMCEPFSC
jgi:hypothetical protein